MLPGNFLRLRNSARVFWGVNFSSRNFFWVLLEALGIFWGFDFWNPFYHPRIICNLKYPSSTSGNSTILDRAAILVFFYTCTLLPFQNSPYRKLLAHSFLHLTVLNRPHKVTENAYLATLRRFASSDSNALFYSRHL